MRKDFQEFQVGNNMVTFASDLFERYRLAGDMKTKVAVAAISAPANGDPAWGRG